MHASFTQINIASEHNPGSDYICQHRVNKETILYYREDKHNFQETGLSRFRSYCGRCGIEYFWRLTHTGD